MTLFLLLIFIRIYHDTGSTHNFLTTGILYIIIN